MKLLATDLDGTLLYPKTFKRIIPKKNIKFLQDWVDAGNKVAFISSRGSTFLEKLKEEVQRPFDYIASTGSYISIEDEIVYDQHIDNKTLKTVLNKINEKYHPMAFLLTSKKYPFVLRNNGVTLKPLLLFYKLYWYLGFKRKEPFVLDNKIFDNEVDHGHVYKIMVFFGVRRKNKIIAKDINSKIREEFPNIESSWSSIINEITPRGSSKANGLKKYCEATNIDPKDVIVVGDSGNDITMFNAYNENSYVMKKAMPSVKKYARYSIRRVYSLRKIYLKEEK